MTKKAHLWKEELFFADGMVTAGATVQFPKGKSKYVWYRMPLEYADLLTDMADPFVLTMLFGAMRRGVDLVVHGTVSPSLLGNLTEFQAAWNHWLGDSYSQIEITAESEKEPIYTGNRDSAVAAFSGGVDSCFTAWRHHTGQCGRLARNIIAGVMVHGFDIPVAQQQMFDRASDKASRILADLNIDLIRVATNYRHVFAHDWEHVHATPIVASLMMLSKTCSSGLIGSSLPYNNLILPYGSNPLTDRLMSSDTFEIIHDGSSFIRTEKIKALANWPEAMENLRVCWQGTHKDRNCGQCEKCIRTILHFRSLGLPVPECFANDVSDDQIRGIGPLENVQLSFLKEILATAQAGNIHDPWVNVLKKAVARSEAAHQPIGTLQKTYRRAARIAKRLNRRVLMSR